MVQGLQGNQGLFSNFPGRLKNKKYNKIHTFPDFFIGAVEGDIICGGKTLQVFFPPKTVTSFPSFLSCRVCMLFHLF